MQLQGIEMDKADDAPFAIPEYISRDGFIVFSDWSVAPVLTWHYDNGAEAPAKRARWAAVRRDGQNYAFRIADFEPTQH